MKFLSLLFCLSFLLSACGFTPVYGPSTSPVGVETALSQTAIDIIPNREGQMLRNYLISRFYRNGPPRVPLYTLDIAPIQETRTDLDTTKSANTTRAQLRLETQFVLKSRADHSVLIERTIKSVTSYNILGSQFASRVTEQNARENALSDLARQIERQISLYFKDDLARLSN